MSNQSNLHGAIAQLGERIVRNDEVVGSIPTSSTILSRLFSTAYGASSEFVPFLYRRLTESAFSLTFAPVVMGLFVYTRHAANCSHGEDRFWRRCRCPKWIRGVLNGKAVRESANTRSWERADLKVRTMEQAHLPQIPKRAANVTIEEAVADFLEDERSRHLSKTTTGQSKTLLDKQLIQWSRDHGLTELEELTTPLLSKFRATWTAAGNNANTSRRKHQRLSGFFWFCVRNEWLIKNPARLLKPIKVKQVPTDYFAREESR